MKSLLLVLCTGWLWLCSSIAQAAPLPPDQAFQVQAQVKQSNMVTVTWKIAPGYYLYQDKFAFELQDPNQHLAPIRMPPAKKHYQKMLGYYSAYENNVTIPLVFTGKGANPIQKLTVKYQGCSTFGFCYPPFHKELEINFTEKSVKFIGADKQTESKTEEKEPSTEQNKITHLLIHGNFFWILLSFFGFGILLAFTPCVLPMIPILSSLIVGQKRLNTHKAFLLSLTYVLSVSVTYAMAGLLVSLMGNHLQAALQQPTIIILFSLLFVALSGSLFGFYEIQMPHRLQQYLHHKSNHHQSEGSLIGTAIMGLLSALIVSPCITPPLVGALAYISQTGDVLLGTLSLWMLGLGMGIPLLIVGTIGGKILPKAGPWMDTIKNLFGVLLLGVAITLVSRIIPDPVTTLLWGALCVIVAIIFGAFRTTHGKFRTRLLKIIGIAIFTYGIVLAAQTIPFLKSSFGGEIQSSAETQFTRVASFKALGEALTAANASNRPVMVDFSADWCTACKEMQHDTFTNPKVKSLMSRFVLLQVDVTANSEEDKKIEDYYNVIAPPTILFFNTKGEELEQLRVVGEQNAATFTKHLENVLQNVQQNP